MSSRRSSSSIRSRSPSRASSPISSGRASAMRSRLSSGAARRRCTGSRQAGCRWRGSAPCLASAKRWRSPRARRSRRSGFPRQGAFDRDRLVQLGLLRRRGDHAAAGHLARHDDELALRLRPDRSAGTAWSPSLWYALYRDPRSASRSLGVGARLYSGWRVARAGGKPSWRKVFAQPRFLGILIARS